MGKEVAERKVFFAEYAGIIGADPVNGDDVVQNFLAEVGDRSMAMKIANEFMAFGRGSDFENSYRKYYALGVKHMLLRKRVNRMLNELAAAREAAMAECENEIKTVYENINFEDNGISYQQFEDYVMNCMLADLFRDVEIDVAG